MHQVQVCVDLGTKATFFGLGLLASKKMRPYAKYFIAGGIALSAAPAVAYLVEKKRLKRIELEEQVEEVAVEEGGECCCNEEECDCTEEEHECGCAAVEEATEATSAEEQECSDCTEETDPDA